MSSDLNNFQPMPKRFMVYQYIEKLGWNEVKTCEGHELCIGLDGRLRVSGAARDTPPIEFLLNNSEIRIIQSTNLFDKDGKEIFEGSILSIFEYKGLTGEYIELGEWVVTIRNGSVVVGNTSYDDLINSGKELIIENIGHILSNPELLEGK